MSHEVHPGIDNALERLEIDYIRFVFHAIVGGVGVEDVDLVAVAARIDSNDDVSPRLEIAPELFTELLP